jgi:glutathione gamma-glutamylcysteinyltransferase
VWSAAPHVAGKEFFAEALADGTATSFFTLIEVFNTQDEPAYCGVASLAMVLNSLAIGA